jgi:hypothetical protein
MGQDGAGRDKGCRPRVVLLRRQGRQGNDSEGSESLKMIHQRAGKEVSNPNTQGSKRETLARAS